jgi:heterodisulfide reductase subunit C
MKREDRIEEVRRSSGAPGCVECGRCVAACPMTEMYADFGIAMSPRGVIRKAIEGDAVVTDRNIWYCTECNSGTDVCPQGVSCRDLIRGLRAIAVEENRLDGARICSACGRRFVAVPVEDFVFKRLNMEPENVLKLLEICPACRREIYLGRNA